MGSYCSTLNDSGATIWIKYAPRDALGPILEVLNMVLSAVTEDIYPGDLISALETGLLKASQGWDLHRCDNGNSYVSEKYSLSLVVQAVFVKVWTDGTYAYSQGGSIQEISGSKNGSTAHFRVSTDTQWQPITKDLMNRSVSGSATSTAGGAIGVMGASGGATASSVVSGSSRPMARGADAQAIMDRAFQNAISAVIQRQEAAVAAAAAGGKSGTATAAA